MLSSISDGMPKRMLNRMSEKMSEYMPDSISECMSSTMSIALSESYEYYVYIKMLSQRRRQIQCRYPCPPKRQVHVRREKVSI